MMNVLIDFGIPSAIMSIFTALLVHFIKRELEKRDRIQEDYNRKQEQLIYLAISKIDSASVLAMATAKAVQRIPDAKCNGDMTSALADVERRTKDAHDFMLKEGIENIIEKR